MSCILYNGTNTLLVTSYARVDLIVLIKKILDMRNSCNITIKSRRNMPIEKENEVREKTKLEMERGRHGLDIFIDIATDPNRVDDITTSTSIVLNRPNSSSNINTISNQQSINESC